MGKIKSFAFESPRAHERSHSTHASSQLSFINHGFDEKKPVEMRRKKSTKSNLQQNKTNSIRHYDWLHTNWAAWLSMPIAKWLNTLHRWTMALLFLCLCLYFILSSCSMFLSLWMKINAWTWMIGNAHVTLLWLSILCMQKRWFSRFLVRNRQMASIQKSHHFEIWRKQHFINIIIEMVQSLIDEIHLKIKTAALWSVLKFNDLLNDAFKQAAIFHCLIFFHLIVFPLSEEKKRKKKIIHNQIISRHF